MAGRRAPNILSNETDRMLSWIAKETYDSIFSIEVSEVLSKGIKVSKDIEECSSVSEVDKAEQKGPSSSITGFAIEGSNNGITILTCAHGFQDAYSEKEEVTVETLKENFVFEVLRAHRNEKHRERATVIKVDCRKDLLLLHLDTDCVMPHKPLKMGKLPSSQDMVVLQGWPPQRSKTVGYGWITCHERSYEDLTSDNDKGYNMRLMESSNLCCASGCSGGPLIDGRVKYVGVYHGTQRNSGYAIHFDDVRTFVNAH